MQYNRLTKDLDNPKICKEYFDMQLRFKDTFYPEISKTANFNVQLDAAQAIVDAFLSKKDYKKS